MALFSFTRAILAEQPINVFNYGKMHRDFTYIDDIVEGVIRVMENVPQPNASWSGAFPDPATSQAPYRIYNIGNNQSIELTHLITVLESCLGKNAEKNLMPLQPGDLTETFASVDDLVRDVGFKPNTPIEVGVERFVAWYRSYYQA